MEGLRDDADQSRTVTLNLPADLAGVPIRSSTDGADASRTDNDITLHLHPYGGALIVFAKP